ncbi:PTS sugar transporter subunit IIA [Alysiella filiformis]|uniref:PTS system, ascorbate-specific IIA component n=1 Tax=Alysiella filiformis DSM 16848 TaxID=1120981 RepID=A0A286EBF3_9NEIS|nr:PTS mannose transporter subunit IIA [Alysiella filiformis]QMT31271.1 PTS mannose transporter subunit IIA [Alysiella filiformis]UBQ55727.1 PTS mannose transporter subunit IIA [Alysiella filiformis DSM 16848]SOD68242.1 PTS system, ascorbate-specific IIA component [Alysiella filiformis DSM 16848]
MIGILIITHETMGAAYTQLAQHFFPHLQSDHIRILNVENTDDHHNIITRAQNMLPELNRGHGVLILTDIFGATPCNAAMKMIVPQQSAMISGLNAPMLIRAINDSSRESDLDAFVARVKQSGIDGIMAFCE